MCKDSAGLHAVGRAACRRAQEKHDRQVRDQAVRDYQQAQQQPAAPAPRWLEDKTRSAQKVLLGVIVVCAMSAAYYGVLGRAFRIAGLIIVAVVLAAAVGGGFVLIHLRREPDYIAPRVQDMLDEAEVPAIPQYVTRAEVLGRHAINRPAARQKAS